MLVLLMYRQQTSQQFSRIFIPWPRIDVRGVISTSLCRVSFDCLRMIKHSCFKRAHLYAVVNMLQRRRRQPRVPVPIRLTCCSVALPYTGSRRPTHPVARRLAHSTPRVASLLVSAFGTSDSAAADEKLISGSYTTGAVRTSSSNR